VGGEGSDRFVQVPCRMGDGSFLLSLCNQAGRWGPVRFPGGRLSWSSGVGRPFPVLVLALSTTNFARGISGHAGRPVGTLWRARTVGWRARHFDSQPHPARSHVEVDEDQQLPSLAIMLAQRVAERETMNAHVESLDGKAGSSWASRASSWVSAPRRRSRRRAR